jgi:hypothetical protein
MPARTILATVAAFISLVACGTSQGSRTRTAPTSVTPATSAASTSVSPTGSGTSSAQSPPVVAPAPSRLPTVTARPPASEPVKRSTTADARTQVIVVRPVTVTGQLAAQFSIATSGQNSIDCATSFWPSPAALDSNIIACAPDSADAIACWTASYRANSVLCMQNPWSMALTAMTATAPPRHTSAPSASHPLGLTLDDGDHCLLRDGGAWSARHNPTEYGTYACTKDGVIWGPEGSDGITRSTATWMVHTGATSGTGALTSHAVRTAYFVGVAP